MVQAMPNRTLSLLLLALAPSLALGQLSPPEIIESFAAKESEFFQEWQRYTYKLDVVFQVLDDFGQVAEQRHMIMEVYFTSDGERKWRKLLDEGYLRSLRVTPEDIHDAVFLQPFVLTTENLHLYHVRYQGRERVDELDTFVFEVEPKQIRKGERYFTGRVFVDQQDLQIVMARGKNVPEDRNNKFPQFETVRQQVDGHYWFPVWTEADEVLRFGRGSRRQSVRLRQIITLEDFKRFEVDTSIEYGEVVPEVKPPN